MQVLIALGALLGMGIVAGALYAWALCRAAAQEPLMPEDSTP